VSLHARPMVRRTPRVAWLLTMSWWVLLRSDVSWWALPRPNSPKPQLPAPN
jgi:hypothetical protein